jgi:four helix bundle suffix protein
MSAKESLIPKHGGYQNLKTFQLAQLIYDVTVRFCDRYIDRRSRTHDQMVQAARSGAQNIAEGSMASGTSKKTELKLTNVARSSLEELRLDYKDFLRQRGLPEWRPAQPSLRRFRANRCSTLEGVQAWVRQERQLLRSVSVRDCPCSSVLVANAALSLLNVCCPMLDRQLASLAKSFERNGGFTERLYRVRTQDPQDRGRS